MNNLNVLFLNSWYPNKILPQNGNFIQEHARAVALYNNVICLQVQSSEQHDLFKVEKNAIESQIEITVYYKKIQHSSIFSFYKKWKRQHQAFLKGLELVNTIFKKIDVVHLNVISPAGLFALYLKKKYNIPFLITEHNTQFLNSKKFNFKILEKKLALRIASKASIICPVSNLLQKGMQKNGIKGDFYIVPNTINTKIFNYKENKKNKIIELLHVSSLKNEHKNINGILNVIKKLSQIRTDFKLTIVSSSNNKNVLEYMDTLNIDSKFYSFKQNKTNIEVAKAMQKSDIFILFSNYETFSLVLPEALICGNLVITSKVGVADKIITNKNGLIVAIGNEDELLTQLNKLMSNLESYNKKAISESIINNYSYEKVGRQYANLYKKIVKNN